MLVPLLAAPLFFPERPSRHGFRFSLPVFQQCLKALASLALLLGLLSCTRSGARALF